MRPLGAALGSPTTESLRADALAGLTTAAMLVPQAMGYAMLAGLPPEVGLYASTVPLVAYALLGTSRQLAVGPVALDSMLVAGVVGSLAASGSDQYLVMAAALAAMVGAIQVLLGLLRAGYLVNFLSRPVMIGFMSAAAITIAASQLGTLLGVALPRGPVYETFANAFRALPETNLLALAIGASATVALLVAKKRFPKAPAALILVVLGSALGLYLPDDAVRYVGEVPNGLRMPSVPWLGVTELGALLPGAVTIALVSFMESIAVGQRVARAHGQEVDASRELIAVGAANVGGALFGAYPVAGGISRTAVNDRAGATSQVAGLVTAAVVAIVVAFATGLFSRLPVAILAAIVLSAVLGLIDLQAARRIRRIKPNDFRLLTLTFIATLALGVQLGLLAGVAASMALFVFRTTRPHFARLGRIPGTTTYLNVARHPHAVPCETVVVLRIDAQLYFGNASFLKEVVREAVGEETRAVILEATGVNQLDYSAASTLQELDDELNERGVSLGLSRVKGPVRDVLLASGQLETLAREGRLFMTTHEGVCFFRDGSPPTPRCGEEDPRALQDRLGCGPSAAPIG